MSPTLMTLVFDVQYSVCC